MPHASVITDQQRFPFSLHATPMLPRQRSHDDEAAHTERTHIYIDDTPGSGAV